MALAAERDLIARQYVNAFADVFAGTDWLAGRVRPVFQSSEVRDGWLVFYPAVARFVSDLYFQLLARQPDSLVRRKRGDADASELQQLARALIDAPPTDRPARLAELDNWFAAEFPHRNPGTTADLVAACLFVALREGIIPLPDVSGHFP